MLHFILIGAAVGGLYHYYYKKEEDTTNRAAETVVPPQEKKDLLAVQPTKGRPATLPSKSYVSATFNPTISGYNPVYDVDPENAEETIKVLNLANRFLYG